MDGMREVLTASSVKKIDLEKRAKEAEIGVGEWELLKEEIELVEKACCRIDGEREGTLHEPTSSLYMILEGFNFFYG